jgi:microcystin degradation protein MlrC
MSVRGIELTEAELARRVRSVVGPKVPIAATFDPHGNEDQEFFKWADLAFAYKYYPHYDAHLQGERAARMLVRMMRNSYRPAVAVRKPPILTPDVNQWTGVSPWMDLVQRALMWEGRNPDTFVNVFFGFPWADVPDVGMCIEVMTNGDRKLADEIADDMASFAWRNRVELMNVTRIHGMDEALQALERATKAGELPAVLGDYSDRSGNAVWILREVVERDLSNALFATIRDPRALDQLNASGAKPGSEVDLMVGGYWDPSSGSPVRIRGRLLYLGSGIAKPHETWAAVGFGRGNVVWLSPNLEQIIEPARLRFAGLDPARFDIFVLKSRVHFRRGFMDSGFAKTALLVEPPGKPLGTVHLDALPYEHVKLDRYFPWGRPQEP